jgi:hypothetical protein
LEEKTMKKLCIIALLLLVVIFQAAADTDLTPLLGAWVNPEYNSKEETPKIVYMADGIGESYGTTYAEKPTYVWTYTVEEARQDAEDLLQNSTRRATSTRFSIANSGGKKQSCFSIRKITVITA